MRLCSPSTDKSTETEVAVTNLSNRLFRYNLFEIYGLPIFTDDPTDFRAVHTSLRSLGIRGRQAVTLLSLVGLIVSTGRSTFHKSVEMEFISKERIPIPNIKFHYLLSFHIKTYIATIGYLYVLLKAKKIHQLLATLLGRLTSKTNIGRLTRARFYLELIWLANVIFNAAFFIWLALQMNEMQHSFEAKQELSVAMSNKSSEPVTPSFGIENSETAERIILLIRETLWAIYGFGWILHNVFFMIWVAYANYLVETETIDRLKRVRGGQIYPRVVYNVEQATREWSMDQAEQLYQKLARLTSLTDQINDQLGFLPLLWLSEVFLSTCLRLTQVAVLAGMQKNERMRKELEGMLHHKIDFNHFENFVEFFILVSSYFAFIIITESWKAARIGKVELEQLMLDLDERSSADRTSLMLATSQMIVKFRNSGYEAWCQFQLNYRLVFAFINAVAPFSVMILQLNGQ